MAVVASSAAKAGGAPIGDRRRMHAEKSRHGSSLICLDNGIACFRTVDRFFLGHPGALVKVYNVSVFIDTESVSFKEVVA